jgi:hypothetical protein
MQTIRIFTLQVQKIIGSKRLNFNFANKNSKVNHFGDGEFLPILKCILGSRYGPATNAFLGEVMGKIF